MVKSLPQVPQVRSLGGEDPPELGMARIRRRDSKGIWDRHAHTDIFKMENQQGLTV